jgi:hypothetical protein
MIDLKCFQANVVHKQNRAITKKVKHELATMFGTNLKKHVITINVEWVPLIPFVSNNGLLF